MDGSSDSPVSEALNYLEQRPRENEVGVSLGTQELFYYQVYRIIDDQLSINVHDKRITYNEIAEAIKEKLIEIKKEQIEGGLADDPVNEFDRRKGDVLSELLDRGLNEYTLTFPLNLGLLEPFIDELAILEGEFHRIDQEKWIDDYFDVAKAEDDTFFEEFLETSPNDFLDKRFAYYEIEYEARSDGYALSRVQDLANLVLGELNYCIHQDSRGPPSSKSDSGLPYDTWSALKEPAFYLVFEDGDYLFPRPMDYGYRRNIGISRKSEDFIEDFYSLPALSEDTDVDRDLINAFMAYQDGLTESSTRKSFFSLWRGLENLSQIESSKREVKERSRFAYEYMRGKDAVFPTFENAHKEIDEVRNSLAHEGVHVFVGEDHRNYAKVLLDGMIDLYFQERSDFDREDFGIFLEYGVEYKKGAGKLIQILQRSGFGD